MSKGTKPWMEACPDGSYLIGAGQKFEDWEYTGPTATVWADDTWVCIETDPHEGSARLNVETLPLLIKALRAIEKARKNPNVKL